MIIGIVLIAILLCIFKDNLKKWEKVLLISCVVTTISFILVFVTNGIIWEVSREIFFITIIITIASLLIYSIIAKKKKEKVKKWVKVLQVIGIIIVLCAIALGIGQIGIGKQTTVTKDEFNKAKQSTILN